jgi:hypothetical protein
MKIQREAEGRTFARLWVDSLGLWRCAEHKELTMKGLLAIVIASAFFVSPVAAQDKSKGRSSTAPGQTGLTPGLEQTEPGGAKSSAPGQKQAEPGGAKDLAPGAKQRKQK